MRCGGVCGGATGIHRGGEGVVSRREAEPMSPDIETVVKSWIPAGARSLFPEKSCWCHPGGGS